MSDGLDARERKLFRHLTTPAKIQRFLDEEIGYNQEPRGYTCYSPRLVLREGVAHCMEGALLGALALRKLGHPALLVDLEAVRDSALSAHQGAVWPWLTGAFADAHFRVLGPTEDSMRAFLLWLAPLRAHLREAGTGSISERFDGDPPHAPRGALARAWSVAEIARVVTTHFGGGVGPKIEDELSEKT